jgi:phosphoribosyl-AMP cyclohydrolase
MATHDDIEEGTVNRLDFSKLQAVAGAGLQVLPAVAQDVASGEVLMIGYVNAEALERAHQEHVAVFWSTSRNALWIKGASSGDYLDLDEIRVNCEQNAILYRVRRRSGAACHTRAADGQHRGSCFYRRLAADGSLCMVDGGE